jgi:transcriptional regulator with XRE-family HTH domain
MASLQHVPRRTTRSKEGVKFGGTVRRFRKEAGLTQETLAERANLSADFLGFIERGDNVPTLPTILQLARALRVQPSKLLKDFDE